MPPSAVEQVRAQLELARARRRGSRRPETRAAAPARGSAARAASSRAAASRRAASTCSSSCCSSPIASPTKWCSTPPLPSPAAAAPHAARCARGSGAERSTRWLRNSCCICEKPPKPSALAKRISAEGCTALASATRRPPCRAPGRAAARARSAAMRCSCGDSVGIAPREIAVLQLLVVAGAGVIGLDHVIRTNSSCMIAILEHIFHPVHRLFPPMPIASGPRRFPSPADARAAARAGHHAAVAGAVGLYQYLALEIMIWMIFALGYNLLLGTPACRRSATARSSASAPTPSACCSSASAPNLWLDLARRGRSSPRSPARWSAPSSRTGAASTTRC